MTTTELSIQHKIKADIHRFDIIALLKFLESLGFKASDIYFQSNSKLSSPRSLCEDIIFSEKDYPKITIVMNMGLLSGNSPLPSLFRKKMDLGIIDSELFSRFINFFDHYLITTLLSMGMTEENRYFFLDWKQTIRQYLALLGLNSVSTLALLFQLCFPELKVQVKKFARIIKLQRSSTILGITPLGKESFLGKSDQLTVSSVKIILTSEEVLSDLSIPWAFEIKRRVKELIYPILERVNLYLQIILVIKNSRDSAHLANTSHLGYCSLGISQKPLRLLIFSGYPKYMKGRLK